MSFAAQQEDVWLRDLFPPGFVGHACEVGAGDGVAGSNTLLLEQGGWTVLCVEPNPMWEKPLSENRKLFSLCAAGKQGEESAPFFVLEENVCTFSSLAPDFGKAWRDLGREPRFRRVEVRVRRLDDLLGEAGFPALDALSIDTEGTELDVLRGLDLMRWRPKGIVIESWENSPRMERWLSRYNYRLAERRDVNNLFVRDA